MPQHPKGDSPPVCLIPGDINLDSMEDDCHPEPAFNSQHLSSHLAKLFRPRSPSSDNDDIPSSQGSMSSQMFELFNIGSQTSNGDTDEECSDYPDLSNLVAKVSRNLPEADNDSQIPRSRTPTKNVVKSESDHGVRLEITPIKNAVDMEVDPLTPTANLKMLLSAASPEIRQRERQKELQKTEEEDEEMASYIPKEIEKPLPIGSKDSVDGATVSRKEKSLGLLCQRFLQRYPENPGPFERETICLDEVAKELMVERRRIYDIVNVLESVEMVSRVAKNRYTWHGKSTLQATLINLKVLAEREGFAEQIDQIRIYEAYRVMGEPSVSRSPRKKRPHTLNDVSNVHRGSTFKDYFRKDKSLGIMSQKFLMLFLVSRNKPINLDLAAKILIGDPSVDLTENAKFKTKIRRLYDIANILTSLDLIRKVHLTESKGRKPAFKYIGPELTVIKTVTGDEGERPISRHSLLDGVKKPQTISPLPTNVLFRVDSPREEKSAHKSLVSQKLPIRKPFSRHSSLDQICEIAERERNRLYFESKSQPSSPVKTKPKSKRALLPKTKSMPPIPNQGTSRKPIADISNSSSPVPEHTQAPLKHFVMIRSTQGTLKGEKSSGVTVQKLPFKTTSVSGDCTGQGQEKLLFKTQLLQQTKGSGEGQPRLVKVSRNQLDSVLKSLQKGNVQTAGHSTTNLTTRMTTVTRPIPKIHIVRMQTATQPGLSTPSTETMVRVPPRKRPAQESLPEAGSDCYFDSKRPRSGEAPADQPSPQDDREISQLIDEKSRPSPRVLHLDPEFQPSPGQCEKTPSPELPAAPQPQADHEVLASPLDSNLCQTMPSLRATPRESTPEIIRGAFTAVHSALGQRVFQFTKASSPVMLLSTPVSSGNNQSRPMHLASEQKLPGQVALSFSSAQPQQFQTSISSLGALRHLCPRFAGSSLLSSSHVVSPVPIHLSPASIVPPGGFMVKQGRSGIQPSSAIINLIPHLTGGATATAADLSGSVPQFPRKVSPVTTAESFQLVRNASTGTQDFLSPVDHHHHQLSATLTSSSVMLTPHNPATQSPADMHTPTYTVNTSGSMPLTPSTYFRSTPGGVYQLTSMPQVVLGQSLSAFQPLNSLASHRHMTTVSSTARRLALVEGDSVL